MINLEGRSGPWSIRVWGLIMNLFGNAVALYGAAGVLRDGSRWPLLLTGLITTAVCLLVLAIPSSGDETTKKAEEYQR